MQNVPLGHVVATPGALAALGEDTGLLTTMLLLHQTGYWGTVNAEDWAANDQALATGERLLSAYPLPDGSGKVWIITEAVGPDGTRAATTVLLPSEY